MWKYTFRVLALTESMIFNFSSKHENIVEEFANGLLHIFVKIDETNKPVIDIQQNSPELQNQIEQFAKKYRNTIPRINGVVAYFKRLKADEKFFFLPVDKIDQILTLRLSDYLKAQASGRDFEKLHSATRDIFENLFNQYEIDVFGNVRTSIGESNPQIRVCRFCHNKREQVTFKNKSHAISEGLGNKNIILYDECDACNWKKCLHYQEIAVHLGMEYL